MKTAIYVRVSTEEQAREGYSISGQLQKLKAFCISQEWEVEEVYVDDGVSAKDMKRRELQRMLEDIKEGKIECVLVYRLDRLTRSVLDLYKMLETFERYECKFKSATEVYDTTTAMGRLFITLVAAMAQWERENTAERVSFGLAEKVRQGKYPLNFAPIGYDLNRKEKKLYINEREAKTVRLIYDKYICGLGSNKLLVYLNKNKIYTKHGNLWTSRTLFDLLKNPTMAGGIRWNGKIYWDLHDPIIPREKWELTQKIIKKRRIQSPASVSSPYIFSGLVQCNGCNQRLTGNSTTHILADGSKATYFYYRCNNSKTGRCKERSTVSEIRLEKALLDTLASWNFSETINKVAKKGIDKEPVNNADKSELLKKMHRLQKRKKKWQYAWADDMINHNDFKNLMKEANEEQEAIEKQLNEIEDVEEDEPIEIEEIKLTIRDIKLNWDNLEKLEKKNLLQEVIKTIHYKKVGQRIEISSIDFV